MQVNITVIVYGISCRHSLKSMGDWFCSLHSKDQLGAMMSRASVGQCESAELRMVVKSCITFQK